MASKSRSRGNEPTALSLLAGAGHDLRQPIQSLLLMVHLIALTEDADKRKQTARSMEHALQGLQAMIAELARLARFETGALATTSHGVALDALTRSVVDRMRSSIEAHGLTLRVDLAPASATTDEKLAAEIVAGLIRNAIAIARSGDFRVVTATHADGPRVDITFDCPSSSAKQLEATFVEMGSHDGGGLPVLGVKALNVLARHMGASIRISPSSETRQILSLVFDS